MKSIVKSKETYGQINLRLPTELQQRIENTFKRVLAVQDINKSELIRDALERGLAEIENQLETTK